MNGIVLGSLKTVFSIEESKGYGDWHLVSHRPNELDPYSHLEFWATVIADQKIHTDTRLYRLYLSNGIPAPLRGLIWPLFSNAVELYHLQEKYQRWLTQPSPHEKWIKRDLARTFPQLDYFNTEQGQEKLFHVIKAYSLLDEQVGYCQGIHFLAGCLLLYMPEEEAFCVLVQLMSKYGLREQFTPKMEGVHERMFQFEHVLSVHVPQVHRHLQAQGVVPSMYASQWFMTLFAYRGPMDLVFCVFDVVFVEGADKMLNFALALMKRNKERIMCLEFESLLNFLRQPVFDVYQKNAQEFIKDAFSFDIPGRLLQKLSKQYSAYAADQERLCEMEEEAKRENVELIEQYRSRRHAYKTLDSKYQTTVKELDQAQKSIALLDRENQELRETLVSRRSKIASIESDSHPALNQLASENAQLVQSHSELQDRLIQLETMMVQLKLKQAETENKMMRNRYPQ